MIKFAPRGRLTHRELQVAVELVTQKDRALLVANVPRVVLKRAQIDVVKFLRPVVAEERVFQLGRAVGVPEKQAERMLWIGTAPAETAAYPDAAVDLKPFFAVRMNQLHGGGALGFAAVPLGVGVDAFFAVKQVVEIHDQRKRGQRVEALDQILGVVRVVHDPLIHPVVYLIVAPREWEILGRQSVRRLLHDVVQKKKCPGGWRGGFVSLFEGRSAKRGRLGDVHRRLVSVAVFRGRTGAVQRVADSGALGFCRKRELERLLVPTAFFAELHRLNRAGEWPRVGLARGGGEKTPLQVFRLAMRLAGKDAKGDVLFLIRVFGCEFIDYGLAVASDQAEVIPLAAQGEVGVRRLVFGAPVLAGHEHNEILPGLNFGFGKCPLGQALAAVGQCRAGEVDGFRTVVVQLKPVGEIPLVVPEPGIVDGDELIDHHGGAGRLAKHNRCRKQYAGGKVAEHHGFSCAWLSYLRMAASSSRLALPSPLVSNSFQRDRRSLPLPERSPRRPATIVRM